LAAEEIAITKTELQIAYAKALADIGGLSADKHALEQQLSDAKDHVRKLQIIIGNRYTKMPIKPSVTPEQIRWKLAAEKAQAAGGTVQQYL